MLMHFHQDVLQRKEHALREVFGSEVGRKQPQNGNVALGNQSFLERRNEVLFFGVRKLPVYVGFAEALSKKLVEYHNIVLDPTFKIKKRKEEMNKIK